MEAERHRRLNEAWAKQRAKDKPAGILADGTLVNADGEPIMATESSFGGFMSDGQRFELQEMEDGSIRLSAEAMKASDKEFGNKSPPQQDSNSSQISEEERRLLQEAMRMLKESAEPQQ